MIKLKNGEAYGSLKAIADLLSKEIPAATAFKVSRASRKLKEVCMDIDTAKNKILEAGAKKKDGKPVLQEKDGKKTEGLFVFEDINKTTKEMNDFMEIETEVDVNSKIKVESLGGIKIKGEILDSLFWLIEE